MTWLIAVLEKNPVLAIILAISVGVGVLLGGTIAFATKGSVSVLSQKVDDMDSDQSRIYERIDSMDKKLDLIIMRGRH